MIWSTTRYNTWIALPVLIIASFLIHGGTLGFSAFSDDHSALWNAGVNGIPWRNGFFRPLSDLTFRVGHWIWGSEAFGHRCFNIVLHGTNAYLLFQLVRSRGQNDNTASSWTAWAAALLFVAYPFHQESVIWLVGRESALGTTTILAGLLIATSSRSPRRYWVVGSIVFAGALCYESALLLPLFLLPMTERTERRTFMYAMLVSGSAYLLARSLAVGWSPDSYLTQLFTWKHGEVITNLPKVVLRLFLPPDPNSDQQLIKGGLLLGLLAITAAYLLWKGRAPKFIPRIWWWWMALSLLIPMIGAVSTRTSESDRYLYPASAFLAALVSSFLARVPSRIPRTALMGLLLVGSMFQQRIGQSHWRVASDQTRSILEHLPEGPAYLLDLPDAYRGAFIFRNGFTEAVLLAGKKEALLIDVRATDLRTDDKGATYITFRGTRIDLLDTDIWCRWTGNTFERTNTPWPTDRTLKFNP